MVGNGGKHPKIAAVDVDYNRRVQAEQGEDREWRQHVRRERSSAYWFAATKWGMLGLIVGMVLGGAGMYVASIATLPIAQEALFKGAAMRDAQQNAINDPANLPRLTTPPAQPAPAP